MENAVDVNNPAYKHGHAGSKKFSPTYQSWATVIQRCTNPNAQAYKNYGGRGISVCGEWLVFTRFLRDMGDRPNDHTLDRVDVNGDYTKDNCRWATKKQQANNMRSNRIVGIAGVEMSVSAWCKHLDLSTNTVWARINKHGYTAYDALTKPKQDRSESARIMTKLRVERTAVNKSAIKEEK